MNYTWGDIQVLTLKKMFLNNVPISVEDLPALKEDRKYNLYLNAMPEAANEGILRLMARGTPIVKKYTLSYDFDDSIYSYQSDDTIFINEEDYVLSHENVHAYYFEVNNQATITIEKEIDGGWEELVVINHSPLTPGSFETYKGVLDTEKEDVVRITFTSEGYLYSVRNIALYNIRFRSEEEVLDNTKKQRYPLRELIRDFYDVVSVELERQNSYGAYNSDFTLEGDNILIIDSKKKGNFIITYKAYPEKITDKTSDQFVFKLPSEMIATLPLYMASELYKDDDISISTQYRNQFEAEIEGLKILNQPMEFADNAGWL